MMLAAESASDLAAPHGMPRAGHPHTGRALWAVVNEWCASSENLHKPAKTQPLRTTRRARLQPPMQAPPHLLHTAEAALDLAVPHGMPRAGHPRTGRALCAVVAECCLLL